MGLPSSRDGNSACCGVAFWAATDARKEEAVRGNAGADDEVAQKHRSAKSAKKTGRTGFLAPITPRPAQVERPSGTVLIFAVATGGPAQASAIRGSADRVQDGSHGGDVELPVAPARVWDIASEGVRSNIELQDRFDFTARDLRLFLHHESDHPGGIRGSGARAVHPCVLPGGIDNPFLRVDT